MLRLRMRDFRCYGETEVDFHSDVNVLMGANGAGKTNLLEAIYYLAVGRSPRGAREADMVRTGATGFHLMAVTEEDTLEARHDGVQGRSFSVNGRPCARLADFYGHLHAVFFSPDDLWLAKSGPAVRRRLLDAILVQLRPSYVAALTTYDDVLAQRNALLREIRARRSSHAMLEVWDDQLVEYGVALAEARAAVVQALDAEASAAYETLAREARLMCRYACGIGGSWRPEDYRAALESVRRDEVLRGFTLVGPHRDDLVLELDGQPVRGFASQGQQRTVVLAIRLAERAVLRRTTGEEPVLLLDDVLSELDASRRRALGNVVSGGGQVFLSVTDAEAVPDALASRHVYAVAGGRVGHPAV